MTGPISTRHADERIWERFGYGATTADWRQAGLDIMDAAVGERRAALLIRRCHGKEWWYVRVGPCAVRVVYDPNKAVIVTVLP